MLAFLLENPARVFSRASFAVGDAARQGTFDGTNCTYDAAFVSDTTPLTVDLRIPFISGVHIFQNSLVVGENVSSGAALAGGTGGPSSSSTRAIRWSSATRATMC